MTVRIQDPDNDNAWIESDTSGQDVLGWTLADPENERAWIQGDTVPVRS